MRRWSVGGTLYWQAGDCKLHVTPDDLVVSDALLLRFCKRMCQIFGKESLTPNVHLHLHLTSCMKDYGPFRSYWLFPFERYNGVLGNQPNNNRSIELQLMRRFKRYYRHSDGR